MKKSKDLKIKKFEFIFIEKDDENISEIMKFCGISEKTLAEELDYHYGGDIFMITKNKNVDDLIGYYLIKVDGSIIIAEPTLFNSLFEVVRP